MTREQALEVALRNMKTLFDGMGGEGRDMSSTVEFKCAELSPIYQQARAALALPPSKPETVNADMLAALRDAECELFYASNGSINPDAVRDALAKVRAAMVKATA